MWTLKVLLKLKVTNITQVDVSSFQDSSKEYRDSTPIKKSNRYYNIENLMDRDINLFGRSKK